MLIPNSILLFYKNELLLKLMYRFRLFLAIFLWVAPPFFSLNAAELYINTDGRVQIKNAEVTHLNNNFITVTLWGTKWILFVDVGDSNVKVTNAGGGSITVWDLAKGHLLYVEGRTRDAGPGKIEINVGLLRDLSIAGSKPAISIPVVTPIEPVSIAPPPPPPAPLPIPVPQIVTKQVTLPAEEPSGYLRKGMRGQEVKSLQEALLAQGYLKNDEVTGYFGSATEEAVKKLQTASGLEAVGFVGPRTKELLASLLSKGSSYGISNTDSLSVSAGKSVTELLTKRLDIGMSGSEVVLLQEFLQKSGWGIPNDGPVTGHYGKVTAKAVSNFQKANGLEAVGSVGPETRELINKFLASDVSSNPVIAASRPAVEIDQDSGGKKITKTLRQGMRGEEVKILQEFLQKNDLGIPDDGPVTGYYGAVTSRAVEKFQQANALEAVGFVGPATRDLINRLLDIK